jgi:hypothetical protein
MKDKEIINSDLYWNTRFTENWETCDGPMQSRFFATIAIKHLPRWLIENFKREPLTLADWGCAQGDGSDVWASYINAQYITGIDFSSVAIEQASQRYPAIRFLNEDWLADSRDQQEAFDVVFSSNTLEHFHKPYDALHTICSRARKAIILALPYKELERIDEHFFSFLPENIPLVLRNGFRLAWSKVVDCRLLPNTLWDGDQIIMVYVNSDWVDSLGLTLSDCHIEQSDMGTEIGRLNTIMVERDGQIASLNQAVVERDGQIASLNQAVVEREGQIASLNQAVVEREGQIASLNQAVAEREGQIASLNQVVAERDGRIQSIISSGSWRLTQPVRFASKLVRSIKHEHERHTLLKTVYWRLPEFLRHRLNQQRHAYIAKRLHQNVALLSQNKSSLNGISNEQSDWLVKANQAEQIIIIPCGFEFDELVNQRPINAAKYFSTQSYFVLFVAWQWSPQDTLSRGCSVVWSNIYQIPLFDFISQAENLHYHRNLSLFLVTIPAPVLVKLVPCLRQQGFAIVYDIMDEWEAFHHMGQAPWFMKSIEQSLVLQADYVCAVSPSLRDKFSPLRSDISVIGNGYMPDVIGLDHKGIAGTQRGDKQIIGYFGHLTDAWFDWRLVFYLAVSRTDLIFEIIGYGEPDWVKREAALLPNIRLLGKVVPENLHRFVIGWSAGIIPFIKGVLAEAVDPIKIYEYLYFGLPVIVTGIRHLQEYPMTYFVERHNILDTLDQVLESSHSTDNLDLFLKKTTWYARFDRLISEVSNNQNIRHFYAN